MNEPMANDLARDDRLILVDGLDREVGTATKLQAHVEGILHRAFSVALVREGEPNPDPVEASEVRWMGFDEIAAALAERHEAFAA